jgi:RND superfamily putative drug exporter
VGIAVMLLAGLTLVPARLAILGRAVFWPAKTRPGDHFEGGLGQDRGATGPPAGSDPGCRRGGPRGLAAVRLGIQAVGIVGDVSAPVGG